MGMIKSDFEIVLDKRNIEAFAVIGDNDFVSLDVFNEIIQVLPLNICFNGLTGVIDSSINTFS